MKTKFTVGHLLGLGCGFQIAVLAGLLVINQLAVSYVMNYGISQVKECPFTTPAYVTIPVNLVTVWTMPMPIVAAVGTWAFDVLAEDDVLPGPRAKKLGLPTCSPN